MNHLSFVGDFTRSWTPQMNGITRIAFGTRMKHNAISHIVENTPDVWIWNGDRSMEPWAGLNCTGTSETNLPGCQCETSFYRGPGNCHNGDPVILADRLSQLNDRNMRDQLCSDHYDVSTCTSVVLSTWGGEGYGWYGGDKRLPQKQSIKQVWLDFIHESQISPRRTRLKGIELLHLVNPGTSRQVSIYLLDTNYYRDPPECQRYRDMCTSLANGDKVPTRGSPIQLGWCESYMKGGDGCCSKDADLKEWCDNTESRTNENYEALCDLSSDKFGAGEGPSRSCDLIGAQQRSWLRESLEASKSSVNIIVTPIPLIGSPCNDENGYESWSCRRYEHISILKSLGGGKCTIIATTNGYPGGRIDSIDQVETGDDSVSIKSNIYQLRSGGEAFAYAPPNMDSPQNISTPTFGVVDIKWSKWQILLQLRHASNGTEAMTVTVDMNDCAIQ
eukprot:GHVO01011520.1.p1 GENE.GHVO01011520.1~~GHVO01011520.1.p1  ORF type:complete len:446 (+),score=39.22 GHVO01011520.1:86-1423(+)